MATVVIVPGSFCPAHNYNDLVDCLARRGVQSIVVDLPSVGRREGRPPQTMTNDVDEISSVVLALMDKRQEVILLTHSYGGIPGTQSLEKLSHKARIADGKSSGIKKVIYLTSVVVEVGMSNFDLFRGTLPDFVTIEDDYMSLDPAGNSSLTFSDMPADEALKRAKQMDDHSTPSFKEPLQYAGYNDVEVHYIVCEDDKIILSEHQYAMIEMIKNSSGREVNVHKLKSGHVPNISQPDNVSEIIGVIVGNK